VFSGGKLTAVGTPKDIFSDYQNVENLGLDLPVTAYLEKELKKAGVNLDSDLTLDGFARSVSKWYKGGVK
ncbi:MAG: hypothetical protein IJB32_03320, partial [Clostridia bacterium]|nr:hypothetical protein [Clostridia bacterium]